MAATLEDKFALSFRFIALLEPAHSLALSPSLPPATSNDNSNKPGDKSTNGEENKSKKKELTPSEKVREERKKVLVSNHLARRSMPIVLALNDMNIDLDAVPREMRRGVVLHSEILELYGLLRQVLEGDCKEAEPSFFSFDSVGKMKWQTWNKRKGMTKEQAKAAYVAMTGDILQRITRPQPELDRLKALLNSPTKGSEPIEVFVDPLSQPSRALRWAILLAKVPNVKFVDIRLPNFPKGFEKINPLMKVPAMNDNGFFLAESMTIARYLILEARVQSPLWPLNFERQARISEYLDWHHGNIRPGAAMHAKAVISSVQSQGTVPINLAETEKALQKALKEVENVFLNRGQRFIASDAEPTLADLWCFSELKQLGLIRYQFDKFPKVAAWMQRMAAVPHYQDVFGILDKVIEKSGAKFAPKANL